MLLLLPLHRHADHVEQLSFSLAGPELGGASWDGVPAIHLDLLHRFPGLCVDGRPAVLFPQQVAQTDLRVAEEADLEVPVAGDAQSVAAAAEVLRHACDEANSSGEAGDFERFAGFVFPVLHFP